jgi:MFS family permease
MTQSDSPATLSLWRHPAFLRYLYVRVAASVALQIHVVAVGWQMYAMTGSPFRLGLIGLVQFIPAICLFPLTGHVADRFDRRWVTFIGEIVEAVAVAILAVASFTGHLTPNLLLAMAFVVGTGRAFEQPSVQTVLPNVVPARILPNAVAASTSGSQTAVVAGPALGGILISLSPTLVFTVCAVIWFTAGLAMITVAMERTATTRPVLDLKTLFSGVAFIIHQKVVLGAIVLDMVARSASACCARRRRSAPSSPGSCWRAGRFPIASAASCSSPSRYSASARSCWGWRRMSFSLSQRWPSSARPTRSAW